MNVFTCYSEKSMLIIGLIDKRFYYRKFKIGYMQLLDLFFYCGFYGSNSILLLFLRYLELFLIFLLYRLVFF